MVSGRVFVAVGVVGLGSSMALSLRAWVALAAGEGVAAVALWTSLAVLVGLVGFAALVRGLE